MRRTPGSSTLEQQDEGRSADMHSFDASTRLVQTALQATDARLHEIDGVKEAINTLERSVTAQKRKLTELYAMRDRLEKD